MQGREYRRESHLPNMTEILKEEKCQAHQQNNILMVCINSQCTCQRLLCLECLSLGSFQFSHTLLNTTTFQQLLKKYWLPNPAQGNRLREIIYKIHDAISLRFDGMFSSIGKFVEKKDLQDIEAHSSEQLKQIIALGLWKCIAALNSRVSEGRIKEMVKKEELSRMDEAVSILGELSTKVGAVFDDHNEKLKPLLQFSDAEPQNIQTFCSERKHSAIKLQLSNRVAKGMIEQKSAAYFGYCTRKLTPAEPYCYFVIREFPDADGFISCGVGYPHLAKQYLSLAALGKGAVVNCLPSPKCAYKQAIWNFTANNSKEHPPIPFTLGTIIRVSVNFAADSIDFALIDPSKLGNQIFVFAQSPLKLIADKDLYPLVGFYQRNGALQVLDDNSLKKMAEGLLALAEHQST